jgi:SAM-dependent methyltransferase
VQRELFDAPYYHRFYGDARERRGHEREERRLGDFVSAYLKYLGQPVRRVLDLGCGFGWWRGIVAEHFPRAKYTGVELSEYLCRKHGFTQGSVVDFRAPKPFDLVICKDTLQYLANADLEAAVDNLARLTSGALYVSILTRQDWEENCDRSRTDRAVYLRSGAWYRRRLERRFTNLGGGLFLSPRSPAIPWELERIS